MGSHGNLAIISGNATPVNVTFTASVQTVEMFQNKMGLTCAVICLETGQNVYTILDDLDLPSQHNESQAKKSIFRKAKDNLMSRLSEDKLNFFSSKRVKNDSAHVANTLVNHNAPPVPNITVTTATHAAGINDMGSKFTSVTTGSNSASVKFQSLEEFNCRGTLRKVKGRSQFSRHASNKLDVCKGLSNMVFNTYSRTTLLQNYISFVLIGYYFFIFQIFDDDFRQVSSVFTPSNIENIFVINRLYYCVDPGAKNLRVALIHNGSLVCVALTKRILYI